VRVRVLLTVFVVAVPLDGAAGGLRPGGGSLLAQSPRLEVSLPPEERLTRDGPTVRATNVVSDSAMRRMIDNGFPARLHYRAELWSTGGLFNSLLGRAEWDLILSYDPLRKRYRLQRRENGRVLTDFQFRTFEGAVATVEGPLRVPLRARPHGDRQYYIVVLEVATLSADDLDELQLWLRGELRPAVRGEGNPGTVLGRGVRQLFARLLGAERRNLQERSATFRVRK
jgi:hypothetical protein